MASVTGRRRGNYQWDIFFAPHSIPAFIMSSQTPLLLLEKECPANPFALFAQWYLAAEDAELLEPSAMTLATADSKGIPDARMVLMRDFDDRGFVFYTNYLSRKAEQLAENPHAALVFYWAALMRQIRVLG